MSIGEQIKAMRKIRGLTQKELAEKCSMADSAVRKYESGKIVPKIEMLKRIADALEMPVGAFLPSMGLGESTGSRIKIARERQGVTQAELAEKMGVTPQTISQYERNIINPKPETIKKFADALGVDARWLEVGEYEDNSLSGISESCPPKGSVLRLSAWMNFPSIRDTKKTFDLKTQKGQST